MRLFSMRLIVALIVGITLVSLSSSYYEVLVERRNLRKDLAHRAEVLGESVASNVEHDLEKGSTRSLQHIVERFGNREHLIGVAIYDQASKPLAMTKALAEIFPGTPASLTQALKQNRGVD